MPVRSPLTSVMPALSMATSAPVPMAMPTSAAASAGASLTPSPAMATFAPLACSSSISAFLASGSMSARTSSMPSLSATALAVRSLSPVAMMILSPLSCSARIASALVALIGSATATSPASLPSTATNIAVLPSERSASACGFQRLDADAELVHHGAVAERDGPAARSAGDTLAGDRVEIRRLDGRRPALVRALDDRLGERMLRALFQAGGQPEQFGLVDTPRRPRHRSASACPRSACRSCRRSACRPRQSAPAPRRP